MFESISAHVVDCTAPWWETHYQGYTQSNEDVMSGPECLLQSVCPLDVSIRMRFSPTSPPGFRRNIPFKHMCLLRLSCLAV